MDCPAGCQAAPMTLRPASVKHPCLYQASLVRISLQTFCRLAPMTGEDRPLRPCRPSQSQEAKPRGTSPGTHPGHAPAVLPDQIRLQPFRRLAPTTGEDRPLRPCRPSESQEAKPRGTSHGPLPGQAPTEFHDEVAQHQVQLPICQASFGQAAQRKAPPASGHQEL